MKELTELQKVSEGTMRFMRGKYVLDEVAGKYYTIDCLKFRQGKKTILSINIHDDHYDFQLIFGKNERAKFEADRNSFPKEIQDLYDKERILHDGKWMLIRVDNLQALEIVKKLILMKKKPNRKPFPKEQAVYSECGHRCDLCIHYNGGTISEEFRNELRGKLKRVYDPAGLEGESLWEGNLKLCPGCSNGGYDGENNPCWQKKCTKEKKISRCQECLEYKDCTPQVGYRQGIEAKSILADDVTWAILPYVDDQYGN